MRKVTFYVAAAEARLGLEDLLVRRLPAVSRKRLGLLLRREQVQVGGRVNRDPRARLSEGWSVTVEVPGNLGNSPLDLRLPPAAVLYQSEAVVVVDKPAAVKVHRNHPSETTVTMTEATARLVRGPVYLVHRLDRGTSGALLFGRDAEVARSLSRQFARRSVGKHYLALVEGEPPGSGEVDLPLHRSSGRALVDHSRGKPSRTRFTRLAVGGGYALVRLELLTGRTHQIRAHMAALGFPLAGDLLYGGCLGVRAGAGRRVLDLPGPLLHSEVLDFVDPAGGARVEVTSRPPGRLMAALEAAGIRWRAGGAPAKAKDSRTRPASPGSAPARPRRTPPRGRRRGPARRS